MPTAFHCSYHKFPLTSSFPLFCMPLLPYVRNAVKTHRITDISHQDITQKSLQDTRCSIGLLHVEAGSGADSSNSDVGDDVIEELRQSTLRLIFKLFRC